MNAIWEEIVGRFTAMSQRVDGTDASIELIIIMAVSFVLGFLFCYVQSKSTD